MYWRKSTVTDDDFGSEEIAGKVSLPWVSCGKHTLNIADKIAASSEEQADKLINMYKLPSISLSANFL